MYIALRRKIWKGVDFLSSNWNHRLTFYLPQLKFPETLSIGKNHKMETESFKEDSDRVKAAFCAPFIGNIYQKLWVQKRVAKRT